MMIRKDNGERNNSRQAGFTLLELVVGLGLMAVVLGISSPAISTLRTRYILDGASRQVAMEISKARMQAIAQNRTVRFRLIGSRTYVLEESEDGAKFQAIGNPIVLPSGIAMSTGSNGFPRFNRQGMAPSSTVVFVGNGAGQKTIQVSALGRVTRS